LGKVDCRLLAIREARHALAFHDWLALEVDTMEHTGRMADGSDRLAGTVEGLDEGDAPSFDAQREETYATIHSAAAFYSVLIRTNPDDPESTTDIVCDLCTGCRSPLTVAGRTLPRSATTSSFIMGTS
jgi:hypothetical protein